MMERGSSFFQQLRRDNEDGDADERGGGLDSSSLRWQCVSPMTQHIILPHQHHQHHHHLHHHHLTPVGTRSSGAAAAAAGASAAGAEDLYPQHIPKRRSRSFGDYIDSLSRSNAATATAATGGDALRHRSHFVTQKQRQQQELAIPEISSTTKRQDVMINANHQQQQQQLQQQNHDDEEGHAAIMNNLDESDYGYGNFTGVEHSMEDSSSAEERDRRYVAVGSTGKLVEPVQVPTKLSESISQYTHDDTIRQVDRDGRRPSDVQQQKLGDKEVVDEYYKDKKENEGDDNPFYISCMYGLINATIVLPVVMSFGNIIYRDDAFRDYMPVLIKLTLVSGFVHQVCFSSLSSLKFAVGSVQDAGLIFLSSMAKDIADYCHERGYDDTTMLATVTVGLGLGAATLGVGLVIIAKLRLAGYVQMLPTCVVAGYLAYIGYFVGYSGIGIMAGQSELAFSVLAENSLYILPGILGGTFIYFSVQRFRHVAVLPCCIAILLLGFYAGLALTGSSIEQATENGWIRHAEETPAWYHTWDYIKLDRVAWDALPQLWMTEVAMLLVVALSSSLDVAAIELEMKRPLDYNRELTMVGISNVVSGLTCGYTGSYIFSQSIFSFRIGIKSRVAGFALAFFQLLIIVIPFPILSFVPNFFYGSLLAMICIDLMYEWLWDFRGKSTVGEYMIALLTFGLIYFLGVEYGILAGVGLYVACRQLNIDVGELKQIHPLDDTEHSNPNVGSFDSQDGIVEATTVPTGSETDPLIYSGDIMKRYQATIE